MNEYRTMARTYQSLQKSSLKNVYDVQKEKINITSEKTRILQNAIHVH